MAGKLAYERYHWFHGQVVSGLYPNARSLSERFNISIKQAQRDIEFMRDRLDAPLVYDGARKGYAYERSGYELPPIWFTGDEFIGFCLALRLAAAIPDGSLKKSLRHFIEKFYSVRSFSDAPSIEEIDRLVSIKNIEYYRVKEDVFKSVLAGLLKKRPLKIIYHTPYKHERTERVIIPLHLLCYMGNWHMIAYCTLRNELRDFALSRIVSITIHEEMTLADIPGDLPPIKDYLRKNFGVISGGSQKEVTLKFSPEVSSWVCQQIWHDSQKVDFDKDGSLILSFPVSGFEEVIREILKYGSQVEVISPPQLRAMIKDEIKNMQKIYM
ncbi:MAG TPA: YafY family protein [Syntrophorhabdaceae bacterium]|nr:YafY family protein [Syntrophorhabdaceae bacterium]